MCYYVMARYYFDTSIWLDFFENRNEPNLPKGTLVKKLLKNVIRESDMLLYSTAIRDELLDLVYTV